LQDQGKENDRRIEMEQSGLPLQQLDKTRVATDDVKKYELLFLVAPIEILSILLLRKSADHVATFIHCPPFTPIKITSK
jgi:hypothetical protein